MKFNRFLRIAMIVIGIAAILMAIVISTVFSSPKVVTNILFAYRIKSNQKVVMLTFDDGPLEFKAKKTDPATPAPDENQPDGNDSKKHYTVDDEILDALKTESNKINKPIPATFFEVGSHVHKREIDSDPQSKYLTRTMTRIIDSGDWIASHTYNHDHYAKKPESYFFKDIEMSYASINRFYKEYYASKSTANNPVKAEVSKESISDLVITKGNTKQTVNIPLRLPFLQNIPNAWCNKLINNLGINTIVYGSWGTDWDQTGEENAPDVKIEAYFKKNKWGDYEALNKKYNDKNTDKNSEIMKQFVKNRDKAKEEISKDTILDYYENKLMSKPGSNGQIIVCHTRAFAKHWLPDLIYWLNNQGYQFAGMNPFAANYYKNFGELINRK